MQIYWFEDKEDLGMFVDSVTGLVASLVSTWYIM